MIQMCCKCCCKCCKKCCKPCPDWTYPLYPPYYPWYPYPYPYISQPFIQTGTSDLKDGDIWTITYNVTYNDGNTKVEEKDEYYGPG